MADTVFYSWQANLPNSTNRGFILKALEPATESERAPERKKLEGALEYCLRDILLAPLEKNGGDFQEVEIPVAGQWQTRKRSAGRTVWQTAGRTKYTCTRPTQDGPSI